MRQCKSEVYTTRTSVTTFYIIVPVCNGEYSAVYKLLPDGGLYQVVRLEVHRGSSLVKDQHLRLFARN